jgi:predicted lipoprotein
MNTAQDHAKAAWRSGGSVPAIEAGILAYNQELIGQIDRKDALLAQGAEKVHDLQIRIAELEEQVHSIKNHIRKINAL